MINFADYMTSVKYCVKSLKVAFSLFVLSFLLIGCVPRKTSVYFQRDISETVPEFNLTLRAGDLVSIVVSASDAELATPFNQSPNQSTNQVSGYTNGIASSIGYLIESDGTIKFPVIGSVKIGGLSRIDAIKLLEDNLKAYLQNPAVSIRVLNFKVTILGDVRNPGTFLIPNERISFPEALGLAGDLNITGKRTNLLLIRTVSGKKQTYRIDITQNELFKSSELYYLQQGDLIYVEPNRALRNSSAINNRLGVIISVFSLVLTSITLVLK
ncbi:MAG: polysaccharide biosynthesis/export family protein [Bacteroidia bacterium]